MKRVELRLSRKEGQGTFVRHGSEILVTLLTADSIGDGSKDEVGKSIRTLFLVAALTIKPVASTATVPC